ncbi:MAG: hypothetical protein NTV06_02115 [candidate division Zixibacteria bacterium]|nr:hypothetical protein [candidate division Zixibacteria bacterium]
MIAPLLLLLTEDSCSRYAKLVVYLVIFLRGGFISIAVIPILGSIVGFVISNIIALLDGAGTIFLASILKLLGVPSRPASNKKPASLQPIIVAGRIFPNSHYF